MSNETDSGSRRGVGNQRPGRGRCGSSRGAVSPTVTFILGVTASLFLHVQDIRAEKASFSELLARAHAEISAGHQWAPDGDNVAQTFMEMMDLLPQATPEQLADFQSMLRTQQQDLAHKLSEAGHPLPAEQVSDSAGADRTVDKPAEAASAGIDKASLPHAVETTAATAAQQDQRPGSGSGSAAPADAGSPAAPSADHKVADAPSANAHSGAVEPTETASVEKRSTPAPAGQTAAGTVLATREVPGPGSPIEPLLTAPPAPTRAAAQPAPSAAASSPAETPAPAQSAPAVAVLQTPPAAAPPAAISPPPVPGKPTASAPAPPPAHPTALTRELYGFGQAAEARGDISGARRYYATAADQGLAAAALALGRLYDPAFIRRNTMGGIQADPVAARHWYQRAAALGEAKAQPFLQTLSAR